MMSAQPRGGAALVGLTEAEAQRRLLAASRPQPQGSSRSYASIVRANVLTVFNLILAGFGAVTLIFGDARDALFSASSSPTPGSGSRRRCVPSARSTGSLCSSPRMPG